MKTKCKSNDICKNNQNTHNDNPLQYNHCRRRLQHALTGILFYFLSYMLPTSLACILLSSTTTLFYILHLLRSKSNIVQKYFIQQFGPLLRDHERNVNCLPGAFWFLLGTYIVVFLFRMNIARTSLLCLSLGDPIASTFGMYFNGPKFRLKYGTKSLCGCFACFVTCVIISMFCLGLEYGPGIWVIAGLMATLMEVSSGFIAVDDNILIPLGTGCVLSFYVFRYENHVIDPMHPYYL